jgi:hypothetical protein
VIRLLVEFLLPLVAPTLAYALWLAWRQRSGGGQAASGDTADADADAGTPRPADWRSAPWIWLGAAGIALVAAVAIGLGMSRSLGGIGGTYVAPRVIDGRIVPGHVDPPPSR